MHSERTTAFALIVATLTTLIASPLLVPYWIIKWFKQRRRANKVT